jgi:hypothetical protein
VRRIIAGIIAFLALTGTFVVLPVYAAPVPPARPVTPTSDEVALGSVTAPQGDAVVTTDGEPQEIPAPPSTAGPSSAPAPQDDPAPADVATSGKEIPGVPALTVSQPDTDTFFSVGVTWAQSGIADVQVQLRVKDRDGEWGKWTTLAADDVEQSDSPQTPTDAPRGGTAPYWTGEAHGVEAIVQGAGGATPSDVKLTLIDPGTSPADKLAAAPAAKGEAHAADGMPAVYSRAQWGADEKLRTWDPEYAPTLKAATVHHTADGNDYTADQVPAIMRATYYYHAVDRGWGDIGYNAIVDKFGRIFEGRYGGLSSTVIGAHAGGFNTGTFGVSMLGNYDLVPVPQATVNAVAEIIAWKFALYRIDPRATTTLVSAAGAGTTSKFPDGTAVNLPTIFGHRDVGNTACPGKYGYARLPEIRDRVVARSPSYASLRLDRTNADTGYITDVSPMSVASVTTPSGATTVFARGGDNAIWYRTTTNGSSYTAWSAIPGAVATSSPAAAAADGSAVFVVVRGPGGGVLLASTLLNGAGVPTTWSSWNALGGTITTAPGLASTGTGQLAVVGRGGDGAVWERVYSGSDWSGWASLGGRAYSAPAIEADLVGSTWRYVVTVVGADWSLWRVPAKSGTTGAAGPWTGGGDFTTHGPGTANPSPWNWSPKAMSTGGPDNRVVLVDPTSSWTYDLGGSLTSVAAVARQSDGAVIVYARGGDGALWSIRYRYPSDRGSWTSLGGSIR